MLLLHITKAKEIIDYLGAKKRSSQSTKKERGGVLLKSTGLKVMGMWEGC